MPWLAGIVKNFPNNEEIKDKLFGRTRRNKWSYLYIYICLEIKQHLTFKKKRSNKKLSEIPERIRFFSAKQHSSRTQELPAEFPMTFQTPILQGVETFRRFERFFPRKNIGEY